MAAKLSFPVLKAAYLLFQDKPSQDIFQNNRSYARAMMSLHGLLIATGAFIALFRYKIDMLKVLAASVVVGGVAYYLF